MTVDSVTSLHPLYTCFHWFTYLLTIHRRHSYRTESSPGQIRSGVGTVTQSCGWSIGRSRSRLSRWRTLTAMAERHIDTVPLSMMHCGWEGNRRSAVALYRILNARAKGHIDVAGYLLFLQCPTLSAAGRAPSFSVRSECRTFPPGHISLGRSPLPRIFSLPD